MGGKCHCYLTRHHFRGTSCFSRMEESSGMFPTCSHLLFWVAFRLPASTQLTATSLPILSCSVAPSLQPVPSPLSLPSTLLFELLRKVPQLGPASLPSYSNQQHPDPVHRLRMPSPSPRPPGWLPTGCNTLLLTSPLSSTRRSGDQPGSI